MVVVILCFLLTFGNCFYANANSAETFYKKNDTLFIEREQQEYQEVYKLYFISANKCILLFKLETQDGSSIEYGKCFSDKKRKIDCFVIYNGTVDGCQFLLFDYESKIVYITDAIFANFYPIINSLNESELQILLTNENIEQMTITDTLEITSNSIYVPYNKENKFIRCPLRILKKIDIDS